jgi:hypothetical protein
MVYQNKLAIRLNVVRKVGKKLPKSSLEKYEQAVIFGSRQISWLWFCGRGAWRDQRRHPSKSTPTWIV